MVPRFRGTSRAQPAEWSFGAGFVRGLTAFMDILAPVAASRRPWQDGRHGDWQRIGGYLRQAMDQEADAIRHEKHRAKNRAAA